MRASLIIGSPFLDPNSRLTEIKRSPGIIKPPQHSKVTRSCVLPAAGSLSRCTTHKDSAGCLTKAARCTSPTNVKTDTITA